MKGKLTTLLLILIFVAGLSLLLYPTISNAYNAYLQSQSIVEYSQQVDEMAQEAYLRELQKAQDYNTALLKRAYPFDLPDTPEEQYWNLLATSSNGIMAYVEIPSIEVTLPIAHGTSDTTLSDYVGHLEWSSLPVGGESTHCVISGHRGLPSSKLFTNIDHLELGDHFYLHVLGETLTYQVDHIAIVEPDDLSLLAIEQGKDYTTLVTCTPYGINSHRLLVRGVRRIAGDTSQETELFIKNEATTIDLKPAVVVIVATATLVMLLCSGRKKSSGGGKKDAQK